MTVEEKSVVDYNNGNPTGDLEAAGGHGKPRVPLVAIYPKEGTLNSDNPFAVLQAPWSDQGRRAEAAALTARAEAILTARLPRDHPHAVAARHALDRYRVPS